VAGIYRQHHPEHTVLYRVLFHYFYRFLAEYESRFELRNESGKLEYVFSFSNDLAPTHPGEFRELYYTIDEIPEGIPLGTFRVKTTVTMHNGITKIAPEELVIKIQ